MCSNKDNDNAEAAQTLPHTAGSMCHRCNGLGWAWEYGHPLLGCDKKWRRCHCKLGKTSKKPEFDGYKYEELLKKVHEDNEQFYARTQAAKKAEDKIFRLLSTGADYSDPEIRHQIRCIILKSNVKSTRWRLRSRFQFG